MKPYTDKMNEDKVNKIIQFFEAHNWKHRRKYIMNQQIAEDVLNLSGTELLFEHETFLFHEDENIGGNTLFLFEAVYSHRRISLFQKNSKPEHVISLFESHHPLNCSRQVFVLLNLI